MHGPVRWGVHGDDHWGVTMRPIVRRRRAPSRLAAGLAALLLTACAPPAVKEQGYRLVFLDNFDGAALDPSVWITAPFGGSLPATVADGVMTLKATADNSYYWGNLTSAGPRLSGEPNHPSAQAWQEGYFEARIRFTNDPWAWPAFWLFSMAKTEAWPDENCSHLNSEWDIMENGVDNSSGTRPAANWYVTALHRNTTDGTDDGYCGQPDSRRTAVHDYTWTDLSDWHTWGGRWTSDRLCTYLDNVLIQCMEPYDTTAQPMHLAFTIQYLGECSGCPPRPSELEMQVDFVRVWQVR
jgi:hypothetical protein